MKRLLLVLSAVAVLVIGFAESASAAVLFDPTGAGPGGPISLGTFDWGPGNALADGGNAAVAAFATSGAVIPFNFYYQARLSATRDENGVDNSPMNLLGPAAVNELTLVAAATEVVTGASGIGPGSGASFTLAPVQTVNYFEIWWDPNIDASDLQGTGFNSYAAPPLLAAGEGTNASLAPDANPILIMSGRIDTLTSGFFAFPPNATDPDLDQFGDANGFGADAPAGNGTGNNYGDGEAGPGLTGIDSITGLGATTLTIDVSVLYYDTTFFPNSIIESITFTSEVGDPFTTVNPSARFLTTGLGVADGTLAGAVSDGVTPVADGAGDLLGASLGFVNGGVPGVTGGPDIQLLVDGSNVFGGTIVPEPGSLTLFTLLFGGLGVAAARRRRILAC